MTMYKYNYGTLSKLYSRLILNCRCALADLEGVMPEFEPSGDREHPGWQTIKELQDVLSIVDLYENALGQVGFGVYYRSDAGAAYLGKIVDVKLVNMNLGQIAFVLDTGASIGEFRENAKFYTGPPKQDGTGNPNSVILDWTHKPGTERDIACQTALKLLDGSQPKGLPGAVMVLQHALGMDYG